MSSKSELGPEVPHPTLAELKDKIAQMRAKVEEHFTDLSAVEKKWLDDYCYARYLRARECKVDKAFAMICETIEWRRKFGVAEMMMGDLDVVRKESVTGKMYTNGKDKFGRSILIMKPRFQNTKDHNAQMQHLVYTLERAIAEMELGGPEKLCLLIDFKGFSIMNAPSFQTQKETLNILQNHYPERLGLAIPLDAPALFNAAYKLIQPFIDPVTKQKIQFLTRSKKKDSDYMQFIERLIDLEQLEPDYGGTSTFVYDNDKYFARRVVPHYCK